MIRNMIMLLLSLATLAAIALRVIAYTPPHWIPNYSGREELYLTNDGHELVLCFNPTLRFMRFQFHVGYGTLRFYSGLCLETPAWLPVPILGFYPLFAIVRGPLRRRRRRKRGLCIHCAYDLTGNVSGTCPECGTRT